MRVLGRGRLEEVAGVYVGGQCRLTAPLEHLIIRTSACDCRYYLLDFTVWSTHEATIAIVYPE
jgi:hypothetical protein